MLSTEKQISKLKAKPENVRVLDFLEQADFGYEKGKPSDFYPEGDLRDLVWTELLKENQVLVLEQQSIYQNLKALQAEAFGDQNYLMLENLSNLDQEINNYRLKICVYLSFFEKGRMSAYQKTSGFDKLVETAQAENAKSGNSARADILHHHLFLLDKNGQEIKKVPYLGFTDALRVLGFTMSTPESFLLATYVGTAIDLKKSLTLYALSLLP